MADQSNWIPSHKYWLAGGAGILVGVFVGLHMYAMAVGYFATQLFVYLTTIVGPPGMSPKDSSEKKEEV